MITNPVLYKVHKATFREEELIPYLKACSVRGKTQIRWWRIKNDLQKLNRIYGCP